MVYKVKIRSKSPYPLSAFEGSSSSKELELPSFYFQRDYNNSVISSSTEPPFG